MKNFTRLFSSMLILSFSLVISNNTMAQLNSLSENFDSVIPTDWVAINNSSGHGLSWGQGDVRNFNAYNGAANSYAGASYLSIGSKTNAGTISNWLMTPVLNLSNGSTFSFYTRTISGSAYPDRLEVRLSTNGSSTNVGSTEESTGDFSQLLLSINPDLDNGGYPDTNWTKYNVTVSGIGTVTGRIAFRYYVTNGGSSGTNSNFIGIDAFDYSTVLPVSLLNFKGIVKDKQAYLSWTTGEEINNKGFEVQVSHDNISYSTLGFVAASSKPGGHTYNYTDTKMVSGNSYYRLKQVDQDGNYKYSAIVQLQLKNFDWSILGNPSPNPSILLQTDAQSKVSIQVVSTNGNLVQVINKGTLQAGTVNIPLNISNAAKGIYFIRLSVDDKSYTKQIMKQ
ncbi:MAG: T9SS type A sorting domain-containing protein [Bacteroidetes bacterium]|nr:T9SS type A sorting domain-containing protein [Bacteroidota bacterium]